MVTISSIPMTQVGVCMDCHGPILMSPNEKQWWEAKLAENSNIHFPKRCRGCRDKNRAAKSKHLDWRVVTDRLDRISDDLNTREDVDEAIKALSELSQDIRAAFLEQVPTA